MGMTMQMVPATSPTPKKKRNFTMTPNLILWSDRGYASIIGILRLLHKCPKSTFTGSIRKLSNLLSMAKSTVYRLLDIWIDAGWVKKTGEDPTMTLELQMDAIWALNTAVASTDSTEEETHSDQEVSSSSTDSTEEETHPDQEASSDTASPANTEEATYTGGYQGTVVEPGSPVPNWDNQVPSYETPVPFWDETVPNWDKSVPSISSNWDGNISFNNPSNSNTNTFVGDASSSEEDATMVSLSTLMNWHFAERQVLQFFGYQVYPLTEDIWNCTPPGGSPQCVDRAWIIQEAERVRIQTTQPPVPSVQEQEEQHTRGVKLALTPEQKARARALKAVIEGQCGKLAKRGANIAENKAVARLVTRYEDTDLLDVLHYLRHIHWKHSKPDNKYKIRGYVLEEEIEAVLRVFAENPDLRTATELPTAPTRRRSTRTVAEPPAAAPTQQAEAGMKQAEAEALAATARQQAEAQGRQITVTPTKEGEAWVITVDWQTPPLKLATIRSLQHWQDLFVDICRIWQRTAARKEVTHHG